MKSFSAVLVVALASHADAFGSSFAGSKLSYSVVNSGTTSMEYIPNGMTKAQWAKIKQAEKNKTKGKDLGKSGITTFQSRSFAEWQKAGGINLFPVDPRSVKNTKDLPYMQRPGGKADDSDLKEGGGKNVFGGFFGKKEAVKAPEPEPEKKNWWTL